MPGSVAFGFGLQSKPVMPRRLLVPLMVVIAKSCVAKLTVETGALKRMRSDGWSGSSSGFGRVSGERGPFTGSVTS